MSIRFVDSRKPKSRKKFDNLKEGDSIVHKGLLHLIKEPVREGYGSKVVSTLMVTGSSVQTSTINPDQYEESTDVDVVMTVKDQE